MTETLTHDHTRLPEFNGDLSRWNQDVHLLEEVLKRADSFEYTAQLPEIVGYLTDEELNRLSGLPVGVTGYKPASFPELAAFKGENHYYEDVNDAAAHFPHMMEVIRKDIDLVTMGAGEVTHFRVHKKELAAGTREFEIGIVQEGAEVSFHIDKGLDSPEDARSPIYVVADMNPTRFYTGPARLFVQEDGYNNEEWIVDQSSLDPNLLEQAVQAPVGAIIRLSLATIHESPLLEESGVRTFVKLSPEMMYLPDHE